MIPSYRSSASHLRVMSNVRSTVVGTTAHWPRAEVKASIDRNHGPASIASGCTVARGTRVEIWCIPLDLVFGFFLDRLADVEWVICEQIETVQSLLLLLRALPIMLTSILFALLIPVASYATPAGKRQDSPAPLASDTTSTAASARATLGTPESPIEVIGRVDSELGIDIYYNIPFAKARECPLRHCQTLLIRTAVGDLRFAPPEPAEYDGPVNATIYGPACLQAIPGYASAFGDLIGPYGMSEDCLQLNVFVPRDVVTIATGMPVLVFVHGGGFFGGSANTVDASLSSSITQELVCAPRRSMLIVGLTLHLCNDPISAWYSGLPVCVFNSPDISALADDQSPR